MLNDTDLGNTYAVEFVLSLTLSSLVFDTLFQLIKIPINEKRKNVCVKDGIYAPFNTI